MSASDTSEPRPIDLEAQRRALREGAVVRRMDDLGTLVVTGSERRTWLNGLLTCDLAPLGPGDGAYGLSVAKNGRILAEVWVILAADRIWIGVLRERAPALLELFERHLIMEDAEVRDASAERGWLLAGGPGSAALVAAARGAGAEAARAD